MTASMNIEEFKDLLETYGADLARWPAPSKAQAEKFLEESDEARQLYADMAKVDDLFVKGNPPADLTDRIVKKTEEE